MEVGIFPRTWESDNLEQVFKEMNQLGIYSTQFNLTTAGLETMPNTIDVVTLDTIKHMAKQYHITLAALSGTFNMIDPDIIKRENGIHRFEVLCKIAKYLEIPIITLCTGSKNKESKWKWHDDNTSEEAWDDLINTTNKIIKYAKDNNIVLAVEIEASNIINTAEKARQYLDVINSEHLKIVMDGANLFLPNQVNDMQAILTNTFLLLKDDIVLAHAKDLAKGDNISFVAAGEGDLDFDTYISLLNEVNYTGPCIMHGLSVNQIEKSKRFLQEKLSQ